VLKILLGNLLFAGCIVAWYFYSDGDHGLLLSGTILAFGCFLSGIFMGYLLRAPAKKRRRVYRASAPAFDERPMFADEMEEDEVEAEAEAEEQPIEPEITIEPELVEALERPIAIAAPVAEPVEAVIFEEVDEPLAEIAAPVVYIPEGPLPVKIHEPAAKVVVDSDGCYEMVVQSEPTRFIPDDDSIITETKEVAAPKEIASPTLAQPIPDNSEFTL